jgi:hypothetical protein
MEQKREPRCPPGFFQHHGISPSGDPAWFLVSKADFLGQIRSQGNRQKQLEGYLVPGALENPLGIWEGLQREGKSQALSYVSKPGDKVLLGDRTIEVPPQPGKLFAIYIRETLATGGQYIIDYWEMIPEDKESPGFPELHKRRYGRRLWPPPE